MMHPKDVCFWIPPELKAFKLALFNRIASHISREGGMIVRGDVGALEKLPREIIPIVGCTPLLTHLIQNWRASGRTWCYWDRSYVRRIFATCLPTGENGGFYRWHRNAYQLRTIRDLPDDRWRALKTNVEPWRKNGRHIVIAAPTRTYARFHKCESWIADTIDALARVTDRQLVIRDKEQYKRRPIQKDIEGAHCLVTHGSNAAVESVILGCPVFVHPDSAAALVGQTDLKKIETPIYPDRQPWLNALAYSQFNQEELINGVLWRLIT
jgi:hypothetical protein